MSRREFIKVPHPVNGQKVHTYVLECAKCGCTDNLGRNNFGSKVAEMLVPQRFEEKGWTVGRKPSEDLCPEHTRQAQEARRARTLKDAGLSLRQIEKETGMPKTTVAHRLKFENYVPLKLVEPTMSAVKADPPRAMSFSDKRIIIGKLEEVYLSEKVGYDRGWNDQRVATDLGVPRAWIEEIRDANFGPIRVDEESAETMRQATALVARAESVLREVASHRTRVEEMFVNLTHDVQQMKDRVEKIAPAALGRTA